GLSAVTDVDFGFRLYSSPALTVQQAYNIDKKMDDGLPQSGGVTATHVNFNSSSDAACYVWAGTGGQYGSAYTTATAGSSTSCFENGRGGGQTQKYSTAKNGGKGLNCALSLKFQ